MKNETKLLACFTLLLSLFFYTPADAQPELHGCHYASLHNHLQPLTPEELLAHQISESRSDTIDILNYGIELEVTSFLTGIISSSCNIRFTPLMGNVEELTLDLLDFNVNSVTLDGVTANYTFDGRFLIVSFDEPKGVGDTLMTRIEYSGHPATDDSGFGGLDFRSQYAYNLGIGLSSNPYNFGRSWFPCFDNFIERATYDISLITADPRKGYAIGTFLGEESLSGNRVKRSYRMDQQLPTYLVGVAVSDYAEIKGTHQGAFGDVPTYLLGAAADTNDMKTTFEYLGSCIDALEYWYGKYYWEQVGYVNTNVGAMEHATLIAYPDFAATGGPTLSNNRLMAHELAHHWWGNVVSPDDPSDMWFKEGHAEYSAHLFTEYTFGKEAFLDQVMTNHFGLIKELHIQEGGYLALSGISYENTYSNHTYYRGASMIHNLRGYLGDSLFRHGTTEFLANRAYSATDAENYRDGLSAATGYDLTSYFDDWIFAGGYAGYEIDSIKSVQNGSEYDVSVHFEQGWRGATHYHTNCPLEISFYDQTGNMREVRRLMTNGHLSSANTTLPFEPAFYMINEDNKLLLAQFGGHQRIEETGTVSIPYTGFILNINQADQPSDVFINYFWFGADDTESPLSRTSSKRFWRVDGQFPAGFNASTSIFYNASSANDWEYDLTSETEDSLILAYRPDASMEWSEYPFYSKNILGNTEDGSGIIKIDSFIPGDYVLANGPIYMVDTEDPIEINAKFDIYPNPSSGILFLTGELEDTRNLKFEVFDISGRLLQEWEEDKLSGVFNLEKDLSTLQNGVYLISVQDQKGNSLGSQQFEIIK